MSSNYNSCNCVNFSNSFGIGPLKVLFSKLLFIKKYAYKIF